MKNIFAIVGNGVAGVEAAKVIRENDKEAEIIIISQERELFYYRPRLIEYLADKVAFEDIIAYNEKWYTDRNIKCLLGTEVTGIDESNRTLVLSNGEKLEYSKLLLANGSNPFMLPVSGTEKRGIFTIKDKVDVDYIRGYCKEKQKAVVIGGGLLGIETANGLKELGLDVTIVEFMGRLLPRQLDKEGAVMLEKMLEEKELTFLLGESTKEIVGDERVEKVILNSGKVLEADIVVFSVGIRPRKDLSERLGLTFNRGIIVNEYMQTSSPDVYAAGDVTEFNGFVYGLWLPSKEQGAIAGKNMVMGNTEEYKGSKLEARLKVVGISLLSAGKIQGEGLEEKIEQIENGYEKLFMEDGKVVGAIVIGDVKEGNRVAKMIN